VQSAPAPCGILRRRGTADRPHAWSECCDRSEGSPAGRLRLPIARPSMPKETYVTSVLISSRIQERDGCGFWPHNRFRVRAPPQIIAPFGKYFGGSPALRPNESETHQ